MLHKEKAISQPEIDSEVALAIAEGIRASASDHHEARSAQYRDSHLLTGCPEVRGPFFCSATVKVTAVTPVEVEIKATILYPKNRKVIIKGKGDLGAHIAADLSIHVAGLMGPDPDQMVGDVAFSVGGASTGFGPVNFAVMKPGCFAGDLGGLAFGVGVFAIAGKGKASLG